MARPRRKIRLELRWLLVVTDFGGDVMPCEVSVVEGKEKP